MQKLIFFCIASGILLFSIIVVNISPLDLLEESNSWPIYACSLYSDSIKYIEKGSGSEEEKDKYIKPIKKNRDRCQRKKAMIGLYYTASNINIVAGGICALLGLLIILKVGDVEKITGLIGLGCGFVGFVLTLVYVIESGLVFNDIDDSYKPRMDSDGSFAIWDNSKSSYICTHYDKDNDEAVLRRYSDWGNKYLSYRKDVNFAEEEKNYKYLDDGGCVETSFNIPINFNNLYPPGYPNNNYGDILSFCQRLNDGEKLAKRDYYEDSSRNNKKGECDKLFYVESDDFEKKIIYDRWLTTLVLSCFIFLFNIGLAIFGFLLFNGSGKTNL